MDARYEESQAPQKAQASQVRQASSYQVSLDVSICIYGMLGDVGDYFNQDCLAYTICTSKALQPQVSLAFLFNRLLLYFGPAVNSAGSQLLLELCPLKRSPADARTPSTLKLTGCQFPDQSIQLRQYPDQASKLRWICMMCKYHPLMLMASNIFQADLPFRWSFSACCP